VRAHEEAGGLIRIEAVSKSFNDGAQMVGVLHELTLDAPQGSILTLLGPSGSGKSTLLRCVAGLETPDAGEIGLGAQTVFSAARRIELPPNKRNIGMVFQSYAIWPHMTVAQNVAYPLESRRRKKAEIGPRVTRALELVGLAHLAKRDAPNLSGGQQQRVALARAIVDEPDVLLLDEPLSNLDAKLRAQMRYELHTLQKQLGLTMLYVTHDQEEALALSHKLALMRDGRLVEVGEPTELFERPRHRFTADFLGLANFLPGRLRNGAILGQEAMIETPFGMFSAEARASDGETAELFFRPHHVEMNPPAGVANAGEGTITDATFLGEVVDVVLRRADHALLLRLHPTHLPAPGETVRFAVPPRHGILFVPQTEAA
jgi:iron(III) transport system ATP-binding protein